jgi:hypothetical protein
MKNPLARQPQNATLTEPAHPHNSAHALVLLGAAVYLYLNLFVLPNIPILLGGDQVFFWLDGQRLLYGQHIYQDFLQFTPPGTDLVYFALFKLFGFRIWVTNALVLALGVAFSWMCFSLACDLMRRSSALLTTAVFLVLVYGKSQNATHHWFSVLAIMGAVKVTVARLTPRALLLSGALIGIAAFFNQTHGAAALLAFAVFLLWRRSRLNGLWSDLLHYEAMLLLGFALALLVLNAHLIATLGLRQLWFFQVTYVTKYVVNLSQGSLLGLPRPLTLQTLPSLATILAVYLSLPAAYLVALWQCWRNQRDSNPQWDRIALLSILGLFFLVEVCMSLNWLRLFAVALPGILLIGIALDRLFALHRRALGLAWIALVCLAARQTISTHRTPSLRVSLPGGMAAISPQAYEKLHEMMQRTKPGDLFFQAGWPGMYLPLQLRNPLYLDIAYAIRREEAERVIQQLQATTVPLILWNTHLDDDPCLSKQPCDNGTALLRDYLHRSYVRAHTFSDGDTLWQSPRVKP